MFNILLDKPPAEFEGYPINTDFRIGIQLTQAVSDEDLTESERSYVCAYLLFAQTDDDDEKLPPTGVMSRGLQWFMTGWITDKHIKSKKDSVPVMDMDVDQWRIYSAFRSQYGINLNTAHMHYWEFMGLLTTLDDCAFTRVVDIRSKELTSKMSAEMRKAYQKQKAIYSLKEKYQPETAQERAEREAADDEFLKKVKIHRK